MTEVASIIALTTVGGSLIGITAFVLGNARNEATKRGRIYERIDEIREDTTQTFQRREICDIHVKTIGDKIDKLDKTQNNISEKIDKLLRKNGIS